MGGYPGSWGGGPWGGYPGSMTAFPGSWGVPFR